MALSSQMLTRDYGEGEGYIEFDVSVEVEKQSPYRSVYQNELALQLLAAGVIEREEFIGGGLGKRGGAVSQLDPGGG